MHINLTGVFVNTDDIKEIKIGLPRKVKTLTYKIFAMMNNGEKILLATEYTALNAVNLANLFKPANQPPFVYEDIFKKE